MCTHPMCSALAGNEHIPQLSQQPELLLQEQCQNLPSTVSSLQLTPKGLLWKKGTMVVTRYLV